MTELELNTDEQLSGRVAIAIADLHDELRRRYSGLNSAEAQLAEALLNAHAVSEEGRQRLQDVQRQIVEAVNNPVNALDTPAGERQFLMFLRSKIAEIQRIVDDGTLTARDQAEVTRALANSYLGTDAQLAQPVMPPRDGASTAAMTQQPAGIAPASCPASMPPFGGLPQVTAPGTGGLDTATSPLASLLSQLVGHDRTPGDDDSDSGEDEPGVAEEDDGPGLENDPDPDPDEPPAAPGDAPVDETGPTPTRPAAS